MEQIYTDYVHFLAEIYKNEFKDNLINEYFNRSRVVNPNFDAEEAERFKQSFKNIRVIK